MLDEIVAQIVMYSAYGIYLLFTLVACLATLVGVALYYMLVGCVYGLAYCILPFYWSYNALFKSRS
jgi:hypothetical protein